MSVGESAPILRWFLSVLPPVLVGSVGIRGKGLVSGKDLAVLVSEISSWEESHLRSAVLDHELKDVQFFTISDRAEAVQYPALFSSGESEFLLEVVGVKAPDGGSIIYALEHGLW
jgi:hypothetical protein